MKINVQMFGELRRFLPEGSGFDDVDLELDAGSTPDMIRERLGLPERGHAYIVMLNAEKLSDREILATVLEDGDKLTFVPPIKGGYK
jgi:molybdopterin converting factor small subunit